MHQPRWYVTAIVALGLTACGGGKNQTPACEWPGVGCACSRNTDCAYQLVCDTQTSTCVACQSNADCLNPPVCDTASHTCVECASDSDCRAPTPACNKPASACVECMTDRQCPGPGPHCMIGYWTCAPPCDSTQTRCGAACVDLTSDPKNCGACGKAVPDGGACTGGQAVCPSGLTNCGSACVALDKDAANCSQCGNACKPSSRGGPVCVASQCGFQIEWGGSALNQTESCSALCAPAGCFNVPYYAYGNAMPGANCPVMVGTAPLSCQDTVPASMASPAPGCGYAGLTDLLCNCSD